MVPHHSPIGPALKVISHFTGEETEGHRGPRSRSPSLGVAKLGLEFRSLWILSPACGHSCSEFTTCFKTPLHSFIHVIHQVAKII